MQIQSVSLALSEEIRIVTPPSTAPVNKGFSVVIPSEYHFEEGRRQPGALDVFNPDDASTSFFILDQAIGLAGDVNDNKNVGWLEAQKAKFVPPPPSGS